MTKITEDLLIERGFEELNFSNDLVEYKEYRKSLNYGEDAYDFSAISIILEKEKFSLWVTDGYTTINITSNLQYIEDLDKFIAICNL